VVIKIFFYVWSPFAFPPLSLSLSLSLSHTLLQSFTGTLHTHTHTHTDEMNSILELVSGPTSLVDEIGHAFSLGICSDMVQYIVGWCRVVSGGIGWCCVVQYVAHSCFCLFALKCSLFT